MRIYLPGPRPADIAWSKQRFLSPENDQTLTDLFRCPRPAEVQNCKNFYNDRNSYLDSENDQKMEHAIRRLRLHQRAEIDLFRRTVVGNASIPEDQDSVCELGG